MRLAVVDGGIVVNVIETGEDVPDWAASMPEATGSIGPGWLWDGSAFSAPAAAPVLLPEVPMWAFETALKKSKLDGTAALPGDTRAYGPWRTAAWAVRTDGEASRTYWEKAQSVSGAPDDPLYGDLLTGLRAGTTPLFASDAARDAALATVFALARTLAG